MNIRPLGFVDTSLATAFLLAKHKDRFASAAPGVDVIVLEPELLAEWKSASALLTRIRNAAAPFLDGKPAVIDRAAIVRLNMGAHLPWKAEEDEFAQTHHRLHVCLVQVPGAWVYSGGEAAVLPVGQVTWVNHRILNSEANFGSYPSYKLVLDIEHGPDAPVGAA